MAYTKFHDPWVNGAECCTSAPGAQPWEADAANHHEQGIFDAAAVADQAVSDALAAQNVGTTKYVYNFTDDQFRKWKKAQTRVLTGGADAKILTIGDSTTVGNGSGVAIPNFGSWPHWVSRGLNLRGIVPSQDGLSVAHISHDSRWNLGAGWIDGNAQGFGWAAWPATSIGYFESTTNGAVLTFTPGGGFEYDRFDVTVFEYTGTGTATIQATGGPVVNVVAGAQTLANGVVRKYTAEAGAPGTGNSVTITRTNTTQLILFAIEPWNSTVPTVRVGNAGVAGTGTDAWTAQNGFAPGASARNNIRAYAPDLTIIDLGINPATLDRDPVTVQAELELIVDAARDSGDVILKTMIASNDATLQAREAVFVQNMIDSGIPVIDVFGRIQDLGGGSAYNTAGFKFDNLHGNVNAYSEEAGWVIEALNLI